MKTQTIAAISTPLAKGGISVIRISGEQAIQIAQKVFSSVSGKLLHDQRGYTALFGTVNNDKKEKIDDAIALVFKAPFSYTGEDVVEISCHGGVFVTTKVLQSIVKAGAVLAQAGEFTKRAYLNGKMDLTAAESVIDVINSGNEVSLKMAEVQSGGRLYQTAMEIKNALLLQAAFLAAWADYPEEDIEEISCDKLLEDTLKDKQKIDRLLGTYDTGMVIKNGISATIVGKPNVGKSTLMNMLAGYQKSIVTEIAGTTRDVVEEEIQVGNYTLKISDTAGIRETKDIVEQFGVDKAIEYMKSANLIFMVFDSSVPLTPEDHSIMEYITNTPTIAIINKSDLPCAIDLEYIKSTFVQTIYISANVPSDTDVLVQALEETFSINDFDMSMGVVANERQRDCLQRCSESLSNVIYMLKNGVTYDAVTVEIEIAIETLLELTGENITQVVVDRVFSNFCVGK